MPVSAFSPIDVESVPAWSGGDDDCEHTRLKAPLSWKSVAAPPKIQREMMVRDLVIAQRPEKGSTQSGSVGARRLPLEPNTIEQRADGSVTVAGHRVRLRRIVEALEAGNGANLTTVAEQFPTIEKPLIARVVQYIARFPDAIARFMSEEREIERYYAAQGTHISVEELRRLFKQVH